MSTAGDRFIPIDEEGYFLFNGIRVSDEVAGREMMLSLRRYKNMSFMTTLQETVAFVEAFDEPQVALQIFERGGNWFVQLPYGIQKEFSLESLKVDEWDRFHGTTASDELPFVLSRAAQAELFNLCEEFDDDSITLKGQKISIGPWLEAQVMPAMDEATESGVRADSHSTLISQSAALADQFKPDSEKFWTSAYDSEETPGWDLGGPHPGLGEITSQLKLPKSRIAVLGAGFGHDAAFFAQQGHLVTAIDFSPSAEKKFRDIYGTMSNVRYLRADVFDLPSNLNHSFDLVFEHTCYCAIHPNRRNDLVKVWRKLLTDEGHLLGLFFVVDRPTERPFGPPYGGSEWELRQRLSKSLDFLYWTRWRKSPSRRQGKELVLYAKKRGQK